MGRIQEIRSAIAACFRANQESLTRAQVSAWIGTNFRDAGFNPNTLQAQLYRSCINSRAKTSAPKILWYEKSTKTYRLLLPTDVVDDQSAAPFDAKPSEEPDDHADSTFALEAHLRDYLARNLFTLEKGLELWSENPPSVEYPIDNRRIDLLAKDSDGVPVVIELKLSKSYDRVIGQALLYQGLVARHLGIKRVRIILVAGAVSKELKIACGRLSDVALFEYALTMETKKISFEVEEGN